MNAPQLLLKPSLDKRPYRLRCRFKIEAYPDQERLGREKVKVAEMFVKDMYQQGWEYDPQFGFAMRGPFPMVVPTTIKRQPMLRAREMLHAVEQGKRFLDAGENTAQAVPLLELEEYWEYELAGVFVRPAVMVEYPDIHEEER